MKKIKLLTLFLFLTTIAMAQKEPVTPVNMQFSIEMNPIQDTNTLIVDLIFHNKTEKDIKILESPFLGSLINTTISKADGDNYRPFARRSAAKIGLGPVPKYIELKTGGSHRVSLNVNAELFKYKKPIELLPGKYKLQLQYQNIGYGKDFIHGIFSSNEVFFTVEW